MKVMLQNTRRSGAFTLIEATIGMALLSMFFLTLYAALAAGFNIMQAARTNLRASQIVLERAEGLRLLTWGQVSDTNFFPSSFTGYFFGTNSGVVYSGTMGLQLATNINTSYSSNMYQVTVTVNWQTGAAKRSKTLSTFVGKYGVQNYVYSH